MIKTVVRLFKDESGATAIEYGLIAALIAVAAIAGFTTVGKQVASTFNTVGSSLQTANTPPAAS